MKKIAGKNTKVTSSEWHLLKVVCKADKIQCFFDNTEGIIDEMTLEVPSIRFNYGVPYDSEIVLETVGELIDSEYTGELGIKEKQFANTFGSYKKVWWRAERSSWIPNFATETGAVFPTEIRNSIMNFLAFSSPKVINKAVIL